MDSGGPWSITLNCAGWTVYRINAFYDVVKGGEGMIIRSDGACHGDHVAPWVMDKLIKGEMPPVRNFTPTAESIRREIDDWRAWKLSTMSI